MRWNGQLRQHQSANVVVVANATRRDRSGKDITTIGLNLAKQVFQVHGANAYGAPLFNRKLRRAEVLRFFEKLPPCLDHEVRPGQDGRAAGSRETRGLLVRHRTQAINALRAHMGELGIIAPIGIANVKALTVIIRDEADARLAVGRAFCSHGDDRPD